jgi:phosphoribosylglycinamide formyltransferase 2
MSAPTIPDLFGTPNAPGSRRLLLLGSGELGREVVIEAMRLGIEVIACDRYGGAPAMQFAHRSHVFDMLDPREVRRVVELERPHYIVPEIEAIATSELVKLEAEGWNVVPSARAASLTLEREGIRRLAAETLGLPTSPYRFASSYDELVEGAAAVGFPCVIKPVMSSSGKGQSVARSHEELSRSWAYALEGARAKVTRVIVEGFVRFDYELTILTVRTRSEGTLFCAPIGHRQERGDYQESWQPHPVTPAVLSECHRIAGAVTESLGGFGLFGVEVFVEGD